jgi:hypothetical protein
MPVSPSITSAALGVFGGALGSGAPGRTHYVVDQAELDAAARHAEQLFSGDEQATTDDVCDTEAF